MSALHSDGPVTRRGLETVLSVLVVLSTVAVLLEPTRAVLETLLSLLPVSFSTVWTLTGIACLLAASTLFGVFAHAARVVSLLVGSEDWTQPQDTTVGRFLSSLVFGILGANILFYGAGSFYVVNFTDTQGGVLFGPYIALVLGSILGVLVLCRTVSERLPPRVGTRIPNPSIRDLGR